MHVAKLHGQDPIALLGTDYFDLSEYVRIAADQGLVIDDPDFLSPQFGDTPLAEGQPLLAVTAGLQEKAYALGLNDATAADVVALQQALTWHVGQNGPLVLEEQQEGSSDSVWFDVRFARFEPDTNVRRAAHGWRMGVLRVWVAPYGTTGTSRLVATAIPSSLGQAMVQTGPIGSLAGDVPALLDVLFNIGGENRAVAFDDDDQRDRVVAIAALPHPSYRVFHGASAIAATPQPAMVIGSHAYDEFAPDGVVLQGIRQASGALPDEPALNLVLDPARYPGRNRVFAMADGDLPGVALRAFDTYGEPLGPTAIASVSFGFGLVDLGVLDVVPSTLASTVQVRVHAGVLPATGYHGAPPESATANALIVAGLVLLPEESSTIIVDSAQTGVGLDGFEPAASRTLAGGVDAYGNAWATSPLASAGLWLYPTSAGFAGNFHPSMSGYQTMGNVLVLPEPMRDMRIEAFVDTTLASSRAEVVKYIASDTYVKAALLQTASSGGLAGASSKRNLELTVVNGGSVVYRSPSSAFGIMSNATQFRLWLDTQGPVARAGLSAEQFGGPGLKSASAAIVAQPGLPVLLSSATVSAGAPGVQFRGARVTAIPSSGAQPSNTYHLDGQSGRVSRLAPGGSFDQDVTSRARGRVPLAAVPTCHGVAAFVCGVDYGSTARFAPDGAGLSVEVRVRERFTFLR